MCFLTFVYGHTQINEFMITKILFEEAAAVMYWEETCPIFLSVEAYLPISSWAARAQNYLNPSSIKSNSYTMFYLYKGSEANIRLKNEKNCPFKTETWKANTLNAFFDGNSEKRRKNQSKYVYYINKNKNYIYEMISTLQFCLHF